MRTIVPRVSLEEAPAIAEELRKRMEALGGVRHKVLAREADISVGTLERMLSGKGTYLRPTLKAVTDALERIENHEILGEYWKKMRARRHIDKQIIGDAFQSMRLAKGLTQDEVNKANATKRTQIIENAGPYSDEALQRQLALFRLKDAHQLVDYVSDHGIEARDMRQLQEPLQALYRASRILRTHWDISGAQLVTHSAAKYKLHRKSLWELENPRHPYGIKDMPSLDIVLGLLTALYNCDQKQPRKYQMLDDCQSLRRIAAVANKGDSFTYGRQFRQLLLSAIDDTVDAAQEVENEVYEGPGSLAKRRPHRDKDERGR
jgi:hypothetical protein